MKSSGFRNHRSLEVRLQRGGAASSLGSFDSAPSRLKLSVLWCHRFSACSPPRAGSFSRTTGSARLDTWVPFGGRASAFHGFPQGAPP